MLFESLQLENFKSFQGKHTFSFKGRKGGLWNVTGTNEINPELGANALGKSTLFTDSLNFVLYGVSSRDTRGKQLLSWDVQEKARGKVTLILHRNEHRYEICRTVGTTNVRVGTDGAKLQQVTQSELEKIIGLSREAFRHAVCIGQFGDMFFDLRPAQKMDLFSQVFGFYDWESLAEIAEDLRKVTRSDFEELQRRDAGIRGEQRRLLLVVEDLENEALRYVQERKIVRKRFETEIANLREEAGVQKARLEKAVEQRRKAEREVAVARAQEEQASEAVQQRSEVLMLKRSEHNEKVRALGRVEAQLAQPLGAVCDTCGQTISGEYLQQWQGSLHAESTEIQTSLEKQKEELGLLRKQVQEAEKAQRSARGRHDTVRRQLEEAVEQYYAARGEVQRIATDIPRREIALEEHQSKPFQYQEMLDKNRRELEEIERGLEIVEGELRAAEAQLELYTFWSKGFKQIRSFMLERTLNLLQMQINNNINRFGLKGWQVRLEVERESQRGTVIQQFSVFIKSPESERWVPWSSWSGGETQRLRLAGTLAFADLIFETSGISTNIQVLDERLDYLSGEGVQSVLNALALQGSQGGRQIYVISHLQHGYGNYAGTVTINMTGDGSKLKS